MNTQEIEKTTNKLFKKNVKGKFSDERKQEKENYEKYFMGKKETIFLGFIT
jgi:hypothetical protein